MRVMKRLQHFQLIIDHLLVASHILFQDNLDGNLLGAALRLTDNPIRASAQRSSKLV